MKYHKQETRFSCGASSLRNAFKHLGKTISERTIRKLAGTTKDGTSEKGLMEVLDHYNLNYKEIYSKSKEYFRSKLIASLREGNVCIVLIESLNHWIAVLEYDHRKIVFVDSDMKPIVQRWNVKDFLMICRNSDKFLKKEYYYSIKIIKE